MVAFFIFENNPILMIQKKSAVQPKILKVKIVLFLLPLTLIFLPANFFDTGKTVCISKLLFNKECLGCGMSRAIQHAIHFEFSMAYQFNKLVLIVLPLLFFIYLTEFYKLIKQLINQKP